MQLVLIASSSRGGSSVFSEYLRRSRSLIHLQGEINPFLVRAGLSYHDTDTGSDALEARHAADTGRLLALLRAEAVVLVMDQSRTNQRSHRH